MLKIINFRTFLYNIIRTPGNTEVQFELVRQIIDYPDDLEENLRYNFSEVLRLPFFSPCMSRYMKIDLKDNSFIIKDAINNKVVA
jgi:hypothetical protein